jgi:hypothetical protein
MVTVRSSIAGKGNNTQVGRSVTVCSRIQPPFKRRVCDNEKDHFKLGMLPKRKTRDEKLEIREIKKRTNHCH